MQLTMAVSGIQLSVKKFCNKIKYIQKIIGIIKLMYKMCSKNISF